MIDGYSVQLAFLLFEAALCFVLTPLYIVGKDPLRVRKTAIVCLNLTCGVMLLCEYLFYVYDGSKGATEIIIMHFINFSTYALVVLLLFFYAMLVFLKLFGRFDFKKDMPCRNRLIAVCAIVAVGLILVVVSQFTNMYYYFDENNFYHRGPLYPIAALLPIAGAILVCTVIINHRANITFVQRLVLISYLVLPLLGEVIQFLFFGNSLMSMLIGFSVLLMFFESFIDKEKEIVRATKTEVRTGLANEHGCIEWLNNMKGREDIKKYAAVFFDLRKFSDINRFYGIENGNRILANFSNIIQGKIEKDEIVGRQFGNQFVAIVKNSKLDEFLSFLDEVEVPFADSDTGVENKVTLSSRIGVYDIDRSDLDGEDILVFAAQALIIAKSKDNDEIVWLTKEILDSLAERKKLESDIKFGLKNGEFIPYYQPKINIKTGKICGLEALSRWMHEGALQSPGTFIPIMEANDTIRRLDLLILKSVCENIAGWLKEGIEVPVCSVNFSRRNLADPELAQKIDSVVTTSGIPKELIEIEVTETADEFSISILRDFVGELHKLGYKVSIDDFGSASSSLTLLREIDFDTIKIDKGFVDNSKKRDLSILSYIVKIAREIDTNIVAEGVEQKQQVDTLNRLGVAVIQGYYFDRPLPKDDIDNRLQDPYYAIDQVNA